MRDIAVKPAGCVCPWAVVHMDMPWQRLWTVTQCPVHNPGPIGTVDHPGIEALRRIEQGMKTPKKRVVDEKTLELHNEAMCRLAFGMDLPLRVVLDEMNDPLEVERLPAPIKASEAGYPPVRDPKKPLGLEGL